MTPAYFEDRKMRALGFASDYAVEIHRVIGHTPIMEDFTLSEVGAIGEFMPVYEAQPGTTVIGQGEVGDFMILLISGLVDVVRTNDDGDQSRIAVVQQGHSLGEMSMLDGEPRMASCVAIEPSRFAVLSRQSLAEVISVKPALGAKILLKLVHILSQRLRNTSKQLVRARSASRLD